MLRFKQPTRVTILVRKRSPLWQPTLVSSGPIIEEALSALHVKPSEAQHKFLVNEKWPFLNIFVFDIYHKSYRSASAHIPEQLSVLTVDCRDKGITVSIAGSFRRHEVNARVAQHHNLNGWEGEPPFFADYTLSTPVSYLDPRDSSFLKTS